MRSRFHAFSPALFMIIKNLYKALFLTRVKLTALYKQLCAGYPTTASLMNNNVFTVHSVQDGIYALRKAHMRSTRFPQRCL